jgi:hypothetical protein
VFAIAGLGGCMSNDEARLATEVDGLIHPGMSLPLAEQTLRGAGFTCDTAIGGRTCARQRAYAVVATCMQRVNLTPDAKGSTLARYEVPTILCASL